MSEMIQKKFLQLNPKVKIQELNWRIDGRLEWCCEHGIGHTVYAPKNNDYVHGCDGCCEKVRIIK